MQKPFGGNSVAARAVPRNSPGVVAGQFDCAAQNIAA
jgi:hypothetical protein